MPGWLKNGNPAGDPNAAPRCGARTRKGTPCQGPAMHNGRCRMHGGLSTGPKTPEGLERSQTARWKHGRRSAAAREHRQLIRAQLEALEHLGRALDRAANPLLPESIRDRAWSEFQENKEAPGALSAEADRCQAILEQRGFRKHQ